MKVRDAVQKAAERLSSISTDPPRHQVEWMLESILNVNKAAIYSDDGLILNQEQIARLKEYIERRLRGEPLQYILGTVEFRRITLKVDRRALIPRPETEGLIEIGLELLKSNPAPKILDVGTGCGAIALSLLDEHPGAGVTGLDISSEALQLAEENGDLLKLSNRVMWIKGDIFDDNLHKKIDKSFDLIISNPPYVAMAEYAALPVEIREYEPAIALTAGGDGLDVIRRLAAVCDRLLKAEGYFICEIGENQGNVSKQIFRKAGWDVHTRHDLSGKPRYLVARKT